METQTEIDPFRENEENQNRKWTRNPFKSRRYILPLVSLFVISLSALIAAILIYFLHVEQQEKRMGQLEQQIVQVQVLHLNSP
jgi:flagellar basal body-associated protein FliL